jgi:hypothetical protein
VEVSGQLHAPVALPPVVVGQDAEEVTEHFLRVFRLPEFTQFLGHAFEIDLTVCFVYFWADRSLQVSL